MLLLDTDDLPPDERVDAYQAMATAETGACGVAHELDGDRGFRKRLASWRFGPVTLFRTEGSGMRYWQTPKHLRRDSWNTVSILTQLHGEGGFAWDGRQRRLTADGLAIASKATGPWEWRWSGTGRSLGLMLDADVLGLPDRMIRTAVALTPHSDIAPLLLSHMHSLHADADRLAVEPGADALGDTVLALLRALVASAAGGPARHDVAEETRFTRILAYVRGNLTDADLTADRIAAGHNLTVSALHGLCEDNGLDLERWITHLRLEGARRDLAAPEHAHRTTDAIARHWGFGDPAHFTRGFRDAFGTTPSAWRAAPTPSA
ncbi:AraC-like DNA-binding protein [Actinocorallia herbida]|uniref:AraC-like DNA-binding protein n=1 Tax=Actinocorallia herbida TaxID=58109 RepID=A0A3N1D3T6_9ACTN|nr:helix-turn-helix domain-containing protein [Actinocorallia herbida]ROO88185.1 AraC-like DNA-binding protein [Actinocorallia herbida]